MSNELHFSDHLDNEEEEVCDRGLICPVLMVLA